MVDWWVTPTIALVELLESGFADIFLAENMNVVHEKTGPAVMCKRYGTMHYHDFDEAKIDGVYSPYLIRTKCATNHSKFSYLLARLLNLSGKVLFIRAGQGRVQFYEPTMEFTEELLHRFMNAMRSLLPNAEVHFLLLNDYNKEAGLDGNPFPNVYTSVVNEYGSTDWFGSCQGWDEMFAYHNIRWRKPDALPSENPGQAVKTGAGDRAGSLSAALAEPGARGNLGASTGASNGNRVRAGIAGTPSNQVNSKMPKPKQRQAIAELVIADDFFRTTENNIPAASRGNRKFLRGFFGAAAETLGWRVRAVSPESQGGNIPVTAIMDALGLPCDAAGWAAACTADLTPAHQHLDVLALTPASLVIGWGMSPSILRYIDSVGAAFIDVEIHSIRFARHLHLGVRTNDAGIRRELERLRIGDDQFRAAAAGLRGYFARFGDLGIAHDDLRVGLFVGQMSLDLASVGGGRLVQPMDFLEQIAAWAKQVDLLVVRPHPAQDDASHLRALLEHIPNALLTSGNTYGLLCADNLAFVSSVSSGVLNEAPYLTRAKVHRLLVDDRNAADYLPSTCSPWIPVHPEVASVRSLQAFDRARQGRWHWPFARPFDSRQSAFHEDALDTIFSYRWGLETAAKALSTLPELAPGQTWNVAVGTPGSACVEFGYSWLPTEPWGVWSIAPRAGFAIPLALPEGASAGDGFRFSLYGQLFVMGDHTPPVIRIVVNGRTCTSTADQSGNFEWAIELDDDAIARRVLVVSIEAKGALRICDAGLNSPDERALGIGLKRIALDAVGKPRPNGVKP